MVKTRQYVLANKPSDLPQLDGPNPTFKLEEKELPDLKDDEVLIKATFLSNDPAQRGWISKGIDPERLYVPPVADGEVMRARGLCQVVESKSSKYKKGDDVMASIGWAEYAVMPAKECQPAPEIPGGFGKTVSISLHRLEPSRWATEYSLRWGHHMIPEIRRWLTLYQLCLALHGRSWSDWLDGLLRLD